MAGTEVELMAMDKQGFRLSCRKISYQRLHFWKLRELFYQKRRWLEQWLLLCSLK
jgi:hypothetical protein